MPSEASRWSGDRLFFPLSMNAAGRLVRVPSDFVPAPGSVFYEVKRTSTKNTYRDKLRTDTFRFAHNIHDRNILFFFSFFGGLWACFEAGALHSQYALIVGAYTEVRMSKKVKCLIKYYSGSHFGFIVLFYFVNTWVLLQIKYI